MTSNDSGQLTLTHLSIGFLRETATWTKFLSIVGFVAIVLIIIGAFFGRTIFATLYDIPEYRDRAAVGGVYLTVFYLLFAIVLFFPNYYLYKFSGKMKVALRQRDELTLDKALEYMKSHYKYIGILTIILLTLYISVFFIIGCVSGMHHG